MKKYFFLVFAVFFILLGCQRDDICAASTETTPLLIISFFDAEEPDRPRSPTNLRITDTERDTVLFNRVNFDSIAIPLKTNDDITEYSFMLNAPVIVDGNDEDEDEEENEEDEEDDENESPLVANSDILSFNYARDEIYVNRACGYKVNYIDLKVTLDAGDDSAWISSYIIEQTEVENETQRHISIFY